MKPGEARVLCAVRKEVCVLAVQGREEGLVLLSRLDDMLSLEVGVGFGCVSMLGSFMVEHLLLVHCWSCLSCSRASRMRQRQSLATTLTHAFT